MFFQEVAHILHGTGQSLGIGQHHDAHTQIFVPVKAAAGDHQHVLFMEEFHRQIVTVLAMDLDAQGQSVPAGAQRLTLPASTEGKNGLLTFTCLDKGRVGVTLVDAQGVHLLAPETTLAVGTPE